MLEIKKQVEIAREKGIQPETVKRHPEKWIPIKYQDSRSKTSKRGYSIKYLDAEELIQYLIKNGIK